jgi:hypothetical protein
MRWAVHVALMGEMINTFSTLAGKPEEERQFGRSRRSGEETIRMDLGEIGREAVSWMHLGQDRGQWRGRVIS